MIWAGYIIFIFVGLLLGLLGGGGSILTVPILVYLFGENASMATENSLFIIGISSLIGFWSYQKQKLVDYKIILPFGLISILSITLTRSYILPKIPALIFNIESFTLSKNTFLLLLFSVLMLFSSYKILLHKNKQKTTLKSTSQMVIVINALLVGIVSGLVGAGGGFLIIPVLMNRLHLPIKRAIGNSLGIIAVNSLLGFAITSSFGTNNWMLLLSISVMTIFGILIGSHWSQKVNQVILKKLFGWMVLLIAVLIIITELNIIK